MFHKRYNNILYKRERCRGNGKERNESRGKNSEKKENDSRRNQKLCFKILRGLNDNNLYSSNQIEAKNNNVTTDNTKITIKWNENW